ncbi:ATP-binding protein [Massilia suwonensis]|uniref:histidine kinase n=1 Tax=Massilia suwonensis TaxID=648895 RepID=A0ABW0MGH2_9BURK
MRSSEAGLNFDGLKQVLSEAVRGASYDVILQSLLEEARRLIGAAAWAAFYRFDPAACQLRMAAAAGLPAAFADALAVLPVGPNEASCGRAAHSGQVVVVEDVLAEPLLAPYLPLAAQHGVRSCWSFPLHSPGGRVLGTLAFFHPAPNAPDAALAGEIGYFIDLLALLTERHLREQENAARHAAAERELAAMAEESERRRRLYETVLSNSPDLAYVFDLEHRFTYANAVLLQMWGKTFEEAIGKTCWELGYEPWHAAMHDREIEQVKATKAPIRGDVPFNGTFGRRIYDYIFVPILGPDGEVEAIAGTTRDVTDRKRFEEELQEANHRKDEFLAMLAHELRNPLAPISAAAQVLRLAPNHPDKVRQYSEVISRQVNHMTTLVNDLLDVSRVTRGMVQLEKAPVDVKSVVTSAAEQVHPLLESGRHTLALQLGSAPASVLGDRARLIQVTANLLANAAKYTPPRGHITLALEVENGVVRIAVRDDGNGIEPALLPHIFDLFVQGKRTPDRAQGGLGLGLALVKNIVGMHGGQVAAHSDGPGTGSTFTVELPAAAQLPRPDAPAGSDTPPAVRALRILLVDDNVDAAATLSALLDAAGHRVQAINDPREALDAALADPPEVFILDIGMPLIDGHALARQLRAQPTLAGALYVALTGYGQGSDRESSRQAGFDRHFVKPVEAARLLSTLAQV